MVLFPLYEMSFCIQCPFALPWLCSLLCTAFQFCLTLLGHYLLFSIFLTFVFILLPFQFSTLALCTHNILTLPVSNSPSSPSRFALPDATKWYLAQMAAQVSCSGLLSECFVAPSWMWELLNQWCLQELVYWRWINDWVWVCRASTVFKASSFRRPHPWTLDCSICCHLQNHGLWNSSAVLIQSAPAVKHKGRVAHVSKLNTYNYVNATFMKCLLWDIFFNPILYRLCWI